MNEIDAALYTVLINDAQLGTLGSSGVYHMLALAGAMLPFMTYGKQSGEDVYTQGQRAGRVLLYQVKMVAADISVLAANNIMDRVDELLTDVPLTLTSWINTYIRRVADIEYAEVIEGRVFMHVGGVWRIEIVPK